MTRMLLLLLLACFPPVLQAQVYKWIDERGVTQYTQTPPPSGKIQVISVLPARPAAGQPQTKSWQEKEIEFRQRRAEEREAQHRQRAALAEASGRQESCGRARRNLENLLAQQRMYRLGESGEKKYIEDSERPGLIEDARKVVGRDCVESEN